MSYPIVSYLSNNVVWDWPLSIRASMIGTKRKQNIDIITTISAYIYLFWVTYFREFHTFTFPSDSICLCKRISKDEIKITVDDEVNLQEKELFTLSP